MGNIITRFQRALGRFPPRRAPGRLSTWSATGDASSAGGTSSVGVGTAALQSTQMSMSFAYLSTRLRHTVHTTCSRHSHRIKWEIFRTPMARGGPKRPGPVSTAAVPERWEYLGRGLCSLHCSGPLAIIRVLCLGGRHVLPRAHNITSKSTEI